MFGATVVPRSSPRCSARSRRRGACSRSRPPALTAAAFCAPLAAFSVDAGHRLRVPGHHAARDPAAVPVLGHVLPGLAAARTGSSRSRCCRRSGTASSSPDRATTGTLRPLADAACTSRCSSRASARARVGPADVRSGRLTAVAARRPHAAADRRASGRGGSSSATCSRTGACGSSSSPGSSEPVLFLLSIGVGVGELVGDLAGRRPHSSTTRSSSRPGCSRRRR